MDNRISYKGIKSKPAWVVKALCLACFGLFMLSGPTVTGAEGEIEDLSPPVLTAPEPSPTAPTPGLSPSPLPSASPLPPVEPDIEAKEFDVKFIRRSTSEKIYLFEQTDQDIPKPGRILLLRVGEKESSEPVMAVRVLKTYPELKQFAAKRVQAYPKTETLESLGKFKALEKMGDIIPPVHSAQDKEDLKELEAPPPPPPPPPSVEPSPTPSASPVPENPPSKTTEGQEEAHEEAKVSERTNEDEDQEDAGQAVTIEESPLVNHTPHWLTLEFGLFKNSTGSGSATYLSGGGFRYAYSVAHMLALRKPTLYDSLTLEGGLFYYKVLGFFVAADAYTVVPLVGTIRYNIHFADTKGFYLYGGLLKNNVISQINGTDENIALLGSANLALGVGYFFQIGPGWEGRIDLGLDILGAGIMLRF